ncbi:M48 family metalloprotease [Uniformispora flossi]|uniref:M48 family metalloprotease n=1 Tax=Uniformispora flossi TaxID=3390723 RepID=UPI003C2FAD00
MNAVLRASLAFVLLAVLYLALVGAAAAVAYAGSRMVLAGGAWAWGGGAVFAFLTALGIAVLVRFARPTFYARPASLRVTRAEQPELWKLVEEAAEALHTRAPDDVRLLPDANAAAHEDTRFLGLLSGRRTLYVGTPLLLALTRGHLLAVLVHEMGHYAGGHTRLGTLTLRWRNAMTRRFEGHRATARLWVPLDAYAKVTLRLTLPFDRRQEYEADAAAARAVGKHETIAALSEVQAVTAAWDTFLERLRAALDIGHAPKDVYAGFTRLLAEPGTQARLDTLRATPPEPVRGPYDSHPPLADRLAALARLPDTAATPPVADTPARDLLADPAATLRAGQEVLLAGHRDDKPRLDWDVLDRVVARAGTAAPA